MSWREAGGKCEWSVFEAPGFKERAFMRSPACPDRIVWYKGGGRSLFKLDDRIYLHDWQAGKVSQLPANPITAAAEELGFSAAGALRVCKEELRAVADDPQAASAHRVIWEQAADGSWREVGAEPINYDLPQGDDCSGSLDIYAFGTVFYEPQAQVANNCAEERQPGELCPGDAAIAQLKSQLEADNDGVEFLAFSNSSFLAYPYSFGDSVHVMAPVFAIEGGQVSKIYDRAGSSGQWDILVAHEHFLVREELELTRASLYEKGSLTPLLEFPDKARVAWIPGSVAAAPLIEIASP